MSYQVLSRKWRPQAFDEVVGQQHVTDSLKSMITSGRIHHGYLFSGIRGIGKTTTARILAKALNCVHGPTITPCNACEFCKEITEGYSIDVEEIDGASNRGVDDVRVLQENVSYAPSRSRYKIFIVDEVHMLTTQAFNALLKTLEEPPANVVFILATTEPWKVPLTILSRCQQFKFRNSSSAELVELLSTLAAHEGIAISPNSLALIAKTAGGSVRDAENFLDQVISFSGATVADREARYVLGIPDHALLHEVLTALVDHQTPRVFPLIEQLVSHGYNFRLLCMELMERLRNLAVLKLMSQPDEYLVLFDYNRAELEWYARRTTLSEVQQWYWLIAEAERKIKYSPNPRYILEFTLAQMTRVQAIEPLAQLQTQLEQLQALIAADVPAPPVQPQSQLRPAPVQSASPEISPPSPQMSEPLQSSPEVARMWAEVMNIVRAKRPSFAAPLRQAIPVSLTADTFTLGFHPDATFAKSSLDDPAKAAFLQELLQSYLGRSIKITTTFHHAAPATVANQPPTISSSVVRPAPTVTAASATPPASAPKPRSQDKGTWKGRGAKQTQQYRPPTQVTVQDIVRMFDGEIEE